MLRSGRPSSSAATSAGPCPAIVRPLDACGRAAGQRDIARRDAGRPRQQGHERRIGFAFGRGGAHPSFEDILAVGALLDAVDGVPAAARRRAAPRPKARRP